MENVLSNDHTVQLIVTAPNTFDMKSDDLPSASQIKSYRRRRKNNDPQNIEVNFTFSFQSIIPGASFTDIIYLRTGLW